MHGKSGSPGRRLKTVGNQRNDKKLSTNKNVQIDEEFSKRMERFSSQGQEELVQSYQLPTLNVATSENKNGVVRFSSQGTMS
jgi:hypothetical protein